MNARHSYEMPLRVQFRDVSRAAFSLIELLLAVSLMSIIVFGLYSMFNQTQKALRGNYNQTDVLEAGRAAIEMIVQDIEKAVASGLPYFLMPEPHMYGRISPHYQFTANEKSVQTLADGSTRTNVIQDVFFLTRSNLNWVGKSFFVVPSTNAAAAKARGTENQLFGTLFRFSSPNIFPERPTGFGELGEALQPLRRINTNSFRNFQRIYEIVRTEPNYLATPFVASPLLEGVVHFKVQPVDSEGQPMRYYTNNPAREVRNLSYNRVLGSQIEVNLERDTQPGETWFRFYGDALPAYLEVELGIMEPNIVEQIKSVRGTTQEAPLRVMNQNVGAVHLFRRMVPVRAANEVRIVR